MDKNSILLYIKLPCVEQQAVKYQTTYDQKRFDL